jgi:cell volume regulation protein A
MLGTAERPLESKLLFDVVFFIVVVSAVIQGSSLTLVARWLGLERPREPEAPLTLEISSLRHVNGEIVDYAIGDDSRAAGRRVKDLALPEGAVIALIARGDQIVPPQGSTYIQPKDHVILVLKPGIQALVNQVFGSCSDVRGLIPNTLEFPLRASTTVRDIRELYDIQIDAQPEHSLAEAITHHIGSDKPAVGNAIRFGQVNFRVLRLTSEGHIEMIGMSILPMDDTPEILTPTANPQDDGASSDLAQTAK